MPKEFSRSLRVAELIQQEIAILIQREVRNPELAMTTVSSVELSKDLSHAKVFVTFLGNEEQTNQSLEILNTAAPYLRSLLMKRVRLKKMPQIKFYFDSSVTYGAKLSALIDSAVKRDEKKH